MRLLTSNWEQGIKINSLAEVVKAEDFLEAIGIVSLGKVALWQGLTWNMTDGVEMGATTKEEGGKTYVRVVGRLGRMRGWWLSEPVRFSCLGAAVSERDKAGGWVWSGEDGVWLFKDGTPTAIKWHPMVRGRGMIL